MTQKSHVCQRNAGTEVSTMLTWNEQKEDVSDDSQKEDVDKNDDDEGTPQVSKLPLSRWLHFAVTCASIEACGRFLQGFIHGVDSASAHSTIFSHQSRCSMEKNSHCAQTTYKKMTAFSALGSLWSCGLSKLESCSLRWSLLSSPDLSFPASPSHLHYLQQPIPFWWQKNRRWGWLRKGGGGGPKYLSRKEKNPTNIIITGTLFHIT